MKLQHYLGNMNIKRWGGNETNNSQGKKITAWEEREL